LDPLSLGLGDIDDGLSMVKREDLQLSYVSTRSPEMQSWGMHKR
jgi:hypothetical protein